MRDWIYDKPETKIDFSKTVVNSPKPSANAFAEVERKFVAKCDGVSAQDWATASKLLASTKLARDVQHNVAHALADARSEGSEKGRALADAEIKTSYGEGYAYGYMACEKDYNAKNDEKRYPPVNLGLKPSDFKKIWDDEWRSLKHIICDKNFKRFVPIETYMINK